MIARASSHLLYIIEKPGEPRIGIVYHAEDVTLRRPTGSSPAENTGAISSEKRGPTRRFETLDAGERDFLRRGIAACEIILRPSPAR